MNFWVHMGEHCIYLHIYDYFDVFSVSIQQLNCTVAFQPSMVQQVEEAQPGIC